MEINIFMHRRGAYVKMNWYDWNSCTMLIEEDHSIGGLDISLFVFVYNSGLGLFAPFMN